MKIIELKAENVKKLRAVEIRPDGNLVEITGKNGAGKTSVMDAIWWALAGASHIQTTPIRKGSNEARIRLDLGEIRVTRVFKSREGEGGKDNGFTTSIVVENVDGARFPSPQKMLDSLMGELSFDPLAFTRMESRAQFEALKRFVPGVDFDAIDAANKADYQKRTDVNRRAKEARIQAEKITSPAEVPPDRVDESALVEELERAGERNAEIEKRKANREAAAGRVEASRDSAKQIRERSAKLRREADQLDAEAEEHQGRATALQEQIEKAAPLPDPIDTAGLRASIAAARASNEAFDEAARARADRERHAEQAKQLEADAAALTKAMETRAAEKQAAIAAAKMPVEGLSFGDGEILLRDLPFDQASDAEQLRTSIAIAMASNPKLRVIRVRDGSLLDEDAMKLLGEMANSQDYQVWIERVDGSGKVGFVLEDGRLRGQPEPAHDVAA